VTTILKRAKRPVHDIHTPSYIHILSRSDSSWNCTMRGRFRRSCLVPATI
jgi:hypothetical protein